MMATNATQHNGRVEHALDARKMWAIIQKNARVLMRDKTRIVPLFMFPIFMILIFGYTTGNIPKHIPTALVAYDHSGMSLELQRHISGSEVFAVRHVVSTEGEARSLLDRGKVRAIVVIPPDFSASVSRGNRAAVTLIVDESDSAVAATARQTLQAIISGYSRQLGRQRLVELQSDVRRSSDKLAALADAPSPGYARIASIATNIPPALAISKAAVDNELARTIATAPQPVRVFSRDPMPPEPTANNTIILEPAGYQETQSRIDQLAKASDALLSAQKEVASLSLIATGAAQQLQAAQDHERHQQDIEMPLAAIHVFTAHDPDALLQPLVYEEARAYGTGLRNIDFVIPSIIALTIFQGAVMGMGRAVAGEKREGSLTRVFLTPTSNATIILGTLLFYVLFETLRSVFIIGVAILFFHVHIQGSLLLMAAILAIFAAVSTSIGLILSSAVKTEPQYMAMAMLVGMPSIFLSGAFFPVQAMPKALQVIAGFLPVTYAADALRGVMIKGFGMGMIVAPMLVLALFLAASITMVFLVFQRNIE